MNRPSPLWAHHRISLALCAVLNLSLWFNLWFFTR